MAKSRNLWLGAFQPDIYFTSRLTKQEDFWDLKFKVFQSLRKGTLLKASEVCQCQSKVAMPSGPLASLKRAAVKGVVAYLARSFAGQAPSPQSSRRSM